MEISLVRLQDIFFSLDLFVFFFVRIEFHFLPEISLNSAFSTRETEVKKALNRLKKNDF